MTVKLRTPQARLLRALMPDNPETYWTEWPLLDRAALGVRAGYTAISGSVTRALNGIRPGSSSGDAHLGLVALGFVSVVELDVDGVRELSYRATPEGVRAYREFSAKKTLPPVRDISTCTNHRYKKGDEVA